MLYPNNLCQIKTLVNSNTSISKTHFKDKYLTHRKRCRDLICKIRNNYHLYKCKKMISLKHNKLSWLRSCLKHSKRMRLFELNVSFILFTRIFIGTTPKTLNLTWKCKTSTTKLKSDSMEELQDSTK